MSKGDGAAAGGATDEGLPANTSVLIHKLGHHIGATRKGALFSLRSKLRHGLLAMDALVHEVDLMVSRSWR